LGGAFNWYVNTGFTGAHSGTPTIFIWPGIYAQENSPLIIPSNTAVNIQLSAGSVVRAVKPLFQFTYKSHLTVTGQHLGTSLSTDSTTASSEFILSDLFAEMGPQTDQSTLIVEGVSITSTFGESLRLHPGSTGSGKSKASFNNCKIDSSAPANGPGGKNSISIDGPVEVSFDNSVLIANKGSSTHGVISLSTNGNEGRLSVINSILRHDGLSGLAGNGIVAKIGSTSSLSTTHNITLSGCTFYAAAPITRRVLYDTDNISTGYLRVTTNGNTIHNMLSPSSAGGGSFLINGPGTIQSQLLNPPNW
jgi:hypothetical protein